MRFGLALAFTVMAQLPAAGNDVAWQPCSFEDVQGKAECTKVSVPEDRQKPDGRRIELNVARLLPLTDAIAEDPVVVLQGGPGQGAVKLADFYGGDNWAATRANRTIILLDQRGTGQSNPLDCASVSNPDDPQSYLGDMFPDAQIAACRKAAVEHADISQYTTTASVLDLEEVRERLGLGAINIYGTSYGTRLALAYIEKFPKSVRSLVLKGVVEPQSIVPSSFAADTERALGLLIDDCEGDATCKASYPNLRAAYGRLRRRLEKGPIVVDLKQENGAHAKVSLSRGVVSSVFRSSLQGTPLAAKLPALIVASDKGDDKPLAEFVIGIRKASEGVVSTGMTLSTICSEDVPLLTMSSDGSTFLGDYWEERAKAACSVWNVPAATSDYRSASEQDTPALLISGYLDPATPPSHAEAVAKFLPNAKQVVVRNGGHSFAGMGGCVDGIIAAFLREPTGKLDASCVDQIKRPPFEGAASAK